MCCCRLAATPSQGHRPFPKAMLPTGALLMVANPSRRGLTHIDNRLTLELLRCDLRHGSPPPSAYCHLRLPRPRWRASRRESRASPLFPPRGGDLVVPGARHGALPCSAARSWRTPEPRRNEARGRTETSRASCNWSSIPNSSDFSGVSQPCRIEETKNFFTGAATERVRAKPLGKASG